MPSLSYEAELGIRSAIGDPAAAQEIITNLNLAATGNMSGPGSSTSNAIPKFNGTSGAILSNSGILIDGSNNVSGIVGLSASTATLSSLSTGILHSNGSGVLSSSLLANADVAALAAIALSKLAAVGANLALQSDASGFVSASAVSSTELGYVGGVTSAIQTQMNNRINYTVTQASNAGVLTLTNGPTGTTGDPSRYVKFTDGLTTYVIPAWTLP